MKKRGVGNIEMILSFLLFIGFVFAALLFFLPKDTSKIVDSSLNYALGSISANTSVELISYSVKINNNMIPPGRKTIAVEFPPEVVDIPANYNAYVENYTGTPLNSERDGSIVYVDWQNNPFIVIRFSEDITPSSGVSSKPALNDSYYSIASSSTREVISESRMLQLNNSYYANYAALKDSLQLPNDINFAFNLKYDSGITISAQRAVPSGLQVYAAVTHRETTLEKTNQLLYGDLSVEVW